MGGRYAELVARVDAFFARAAARHGADIQCRAGCTACCRAGLTVTGVEAAAIAEQVRGLPEDARRRLAARIKGAREASAQSSEDTIADAVTNTAAPAALKATAETAAVAAAAAAAGTAAAAVADTAAAAVADTAAPRVAAAETSEEPSAPALGPCVALEPDGRCAIYPARPIVCRSHGLPLRLGRRPGGLPIIESCSLNFTGPGGPAAADPDCILDQETLSTVLWAIDAEHARATDRPLGERSPLEELLAAALAAPPPG